MPVSVLDVVASEYATRTEMRVFALTSFGSGKMTMLDGTYPTAVSIRTLAGTWMISVSLPAPPVASSIIHSYVVSTAASGVCQHHVRPAI